MKCTCAECIHHKPTAPAYVRTLSLSLFLPRSGSANVYQILWGVAVDSVIGMGAHDNLLKYIS